MNTRVTAWVERWACMPSDLRVTGHHGRESLFLFSYRSGVIPIPVHNGHASWAPYRGSD